MTADEDQAWFDALAGRGGVDGGPDAQEAAALRALIQAQTLEEAQVPLIDAGREADLIRRASIEGLLPAAAADPVFRPWWRTLLQTPGRFALASLAMAVIAVGVWRFSTPSEETLRSDANGVVRLESRDPQLAAGNIARELSAAGVHVSEYQRLGRIGIDADLPQPLPPEVRRVLERHRIPIPKDGTLSVEITAQR